MVIDRRSEEDKHFDGKKHQRKGHRIIFLKNQLRLDSAVIMHKVFMIC